MLVYILRSNDFSEEEVENFSNRITKPIKKDVMNGLEVLMKKGFDQGIELGLEQGIEQGVEQGIQKGVIALFEKGFDMEAIAEMLDLDLEFVEKTIIDIENEEA